MIKIENRESCFPSSISFRFVAQRGTRSAQAILRENEGILPLMDAGEKQSAEEAKRCFVFFHLLFVGLVLLATS